MIIPFTPSINGPAFSVPVTIDGIAYTLVAIWNIAGQRWYFSLTQQGSVVYYGPIIGSPIGTDIPLCPALFTQTFIYRVHSNQFEIL